MKVTKQAGNIVDFDPNKLRQSLLKSEANPKLVEEIMRAIQSQLYDKMATKKIYKIGPE